MGGWNATRGWFWSNGFGPRPSSGTAPAISRNGFAGPSVSAKKNSVTARPTIVAHATIGSLARARNRHTVIARYAVSASTHSRIDPSSADHAAVNVYRPGVPRATLLAT